MKHLIWLFLVTMVSCNGVEKVEVTANDGEVGPKGDQGESIVGPEGPAGKDGQDAPDISAQLLALQNELDALRDSLDNASVQEALDSLQDQIDDLNSRGDSAVVLLFPAGCMQVGNFFVKSGSNKVYKVASCSGNNSSAVAADLRANSNQDGYSVMFLNSNTLAVGSASGIVLLSFN